jgi:O-6-methylguanine DNA methyltransferase
MYAGRPNAARAVGTILRKNSDTQIPCHRVIKSDGSIGRYNGLQGEKQKLLRREGVEL